MTGYFYLALTTLSTAWIMLGLREIKRWNLDLLQVITFNYTIATICGLIASPSSISNVAAEPGALGLGLYLGVVFIGLFFLMGIAAQRIGVAYMTVVTKMSLVLPTLFAWLYYQDDLSLLNGIGVVIALGSVFLISYRPKGPEQMSQGGGKKGVWMKFLLVSVLFLGSGINDICFKVFDEEYSSAVSQTDFPVVIFGVSSLIGLLIVFIRMAQTKAKFNWGTLLAGLLIGVPNYFSLKFLVQTLDHLPGTVFFPVNNTALLLVTGLVGVLVYREKLNRWNLIGFLFAILGVVFLV